MRNIKFIYIISIILLIISCRNNHHKTLSDLGVSSATLIYPHSNTTDLLVTKEVKDTSLDLTKMGNPVFVIPENGRPALLGENDNENLDKFDEIKAVVYVDSYFLQDPDISAKYDKTTIADTKVINQLFKKLHLGYQLNIDSIKYSDLSTIKTNGAINTDNIIQELIDRKIYDSNKKYQIYLFNQSEFFNTANAITIKYGDNYLIMGDGELLTTPMLLAHEFGHAFGLTHNSELIEDPAFINMYNLMHESNIGCVRGLTCRQLLLTQTKEYVHEFMDSKANIYYPEADSCLCNLGRDNILVDKVQRYLNSIDRNIHDTPLVGDHGALKPLLGELDNQTVKSSIDSALRENYKNEWINFINDPSIISESVYVSKRITSNAKLRRNNLVRWLAENLEAMNYKRSVANYSNLLKGDTLIKYIGKYIQEVESIEVRCIDCCGLCPKDIVTVTEIVEVTGPPIPCDCDRMEAECGSGSNCNRCIGDFVENGGNQEKFSVNLVNKSDQNAILDLYTNMEELFCSIGTGNDIRSSEKIEGILELINNSDLIKFKYSEN